MTTLEAVEYLVYYKDITLDFSLTQDDYQILKRLHELVTEHILARLATVKDEWTNSIRDASIQLENLGFRFEFTDKEAEKRVFCVGVISYF